MSTWRFTAIGALAAVVLGGATATAPAATFTPTGTLHYEYLYPDLSTPYDDDPADYVGLGSFLTIYNWVHLVISENNLTLNFDYNFGVVDTEFSGPQYSDLTDSYKDFSEVALNPATNVVGFDLSRIIFDANSIAINLQGLIPMRGQTISIDVNPVSAVPLPAALPLLATAVGGLAVFGRWRRKRPATTALA